MPQSPTTKIRFGPFELDPAAGELRKNGILVRLQPQPLKVLLLLSQRAGQVVTREEIQRCLWSDSTFVDFGRGINFSINQIRGALADGAEKPRYIETLPRRGYRFIATASGNGTESRAEVSEEASRPQEGRVPPAEHGKDKQVQIAEVRAEPTPSAPNAWRSWGKMAAIGLMFIVFVAITAYGLRRWTTQTSSFESLRFSKLTSSGKAEDAAISPDGNYIVYAQRDSKGSGLWLRQISSGSDVQILPSEEPDFRGLTFSPDGNSIYFVRTRKDTGTFKDLFAIPVLGGAYRLLTRDIDAPVSFSPDGHQFAYSRGMPSPARVEIRIANTDGSRDRLLAAIDGTSYSFQTGAAWSPNGRTIAVSFMLRGERSGYVLDYISVSDGSIRELFWNAGVIGRPLWLPESDKVLVEVDDSSGRGQLWTIAVANGDRRRVTNDLSNWGIRIDTTRDARKVAAIQWSLSANIWKSAGANPSEAKQITSGEMPMVAAVPASSGKILAVSGDGQLLSLNGDGTERIPLSGLRDVAPPAVCGQVAVAASYASEEGDDSRADAGKVNATKLAIGRLIVPRSYQSGPGRIVRIDSDGLNATTLARGLVYSPTCSPDGRLLYYVLMGTSQKILRIPIEGGEPIIVGEVPGVTIRGTMRVSPDGRFLAFPYDVFVPKPVLKLALMSTDQGKIYKEFELPPEAYREACLRWSPGGDAVQFLMTKGDVTNIWEQPLAGGNPKQITNFTSGRIFDFNWSEDGTVLLTSRGEISSDVILLSNLR